MFDVLLQFTKKYESDMNELKKEKAKTNDNLEIIANDLKKLKEDTKKIADIKFRSRKNEDDIKDIVHDLKQIEDSRKMEMEDLRNEQNQKI